MYPTTSRIEMCGMIIKLQLNVRKTGKLVNQDIYRNNSHLYWSAVAQRCQTWSDFHETNTTAEVVKLNLSLP